MAPFIKVAFRAACHPSPLHTAHKRKMCPDFHFCSIIKGKSKTAQIHHIVKLVSWLQCSLTQSNKSWWWCALGWKTELALKRQWVITMVLHDLCACECATMPHPLPSRSSLQGNRCQRSCSAGYYHDKQEDECRPCHQACATCAGESSGARIHLFLLVSFGCV